MYDMATLESLAPVARAEALMESMQQPGSVTVDQVNFIAEATDNEKSKVARILLNDPNGLLSGNARSFVLRAIGKWKSSR